MARLMTDDEFEATINSMISAGLVTRAADIREHNEAWRELVAEKDQEIRMLEEELETIEEDLW